jgi:N-methylhydantoinase A
VSARIGVDIGGTFTDLVYFDDVSGEVVVGKVPTTPASPEEGCISAVAAVVPDEVLQRSAYFLHGTTVGLNALLERRGARVGLLCTAGFRDVLEIGNGSRDTYNLLWKPPAPLVTRDLRRPVRQRTTFDGQVLTPLEKADVLDALALFRGAGVSSIAVVFLHAYANPAHELEAEALLRGAGFEGAISLSHQVSGEYRDFERASTTTIDAFVRARMSGYIDHIEGSLRKRGFKGTCLMTRSGSGSMTFAEAHKRPFETIMSGPVAGAEGAAEYARRFDLSRLITADVGGTSFDTCLILDGRPQVLHQGSIAGLPIQAPWVDVRSIGAGGGSIARIDRGGLLAVGPESAGARPGPACYGRGGTAATVTDAAFHLGMLGEGLLASGLRLDPEAAARALAAVAGELSYPCDDAARGIITIVGHHMASAIRELTIEQGMDPRAFKILAFGGAGPMMGTLLARELGIAEVVVPPHAGNFSAWGLLGADLLRSRARTRVMPLDGATVSEVNRIIAELLSVLRQDSTELTSALAEQVEVSLDLRFDGQEHTLTIVPEHENGWVTSSLPELERHFGEMYLRSFGVLLQDRVQVVSVRAALRRVLPRRQERASDSIGGASATINAFSFAAGERCDFKTTYRGSLPPGGRFQGPAIIYEPTTTTYVDVDFTYGVDRNAALVLRREEA